MTNSYLQPLDGIRALAFLLVFVSHAGYGALPGGFGVTVFFFLSGYLITSLLRKEFEQRGTISLAGFYRRRACRILPPLYCVLAAVTLLNAIGIPAHEASPGGLASIFFYYFNYRVLFLGIAGAHVPTGMGVLWSLMVEEHFYLLFPLAYLWMVRRRPTPRRQALWLLAACLLALLWRLVLVYVGHSGLTGEVLWTYCASDARFDSILWGSLLAVAANPWCGDRPGWIERRKGLYALVGLALLTVSFVLREPHFRETARYTLQGLALAPVFYFLVAAPTSKAARLLASAPLRTLGSISYTLYLVHFFLLDLMARSTPSSRALRALAALAAAVVLGLAMRRCIEQPFRRLGRGNGAQREVLP
jgi:peptidoglycan/LPS O-acetylase OafA/YrhL